MDNQLQELKEFVKYRTGKTPDNIRYLIEKFEEQIEIIEGQQTEIDWLRSLPLSNE